jgi:hypothetical protein
MFTRFVMVCARGWVMPRVFPRRCALRSCQIPKELSDKEEQRVQGEMAALYPLLDRCEYDFNVTDTLNEAQTDARVKWQ